MKTGGTNGGGGVAGAEHAHLARACTEAINNAVPGIVERLAVLIDERLLPERRRIIFPSPESNSGKRAVKP